ncbi:DUF4198 domain-containing protein [Fuchsiella alkaliacetigena]|uniref:DUF4198 domain-containing protein n=1 Tax=Fuchsiella alkaliacetigena TaxID=957042 RepID=UPI00200B03C6|nr:DUF4198 domain-containing protein [Fuchsiella alkaliacetigena]MCK8825983.1 DUF4198 domain-containing protein [Fuchsiella alkaliacetigena]
MKKGIIVLLVMSITILIFSSVALAHCAWIELPLRAEIGEEIEFDIFWADPDDPIDERDMTELSLQFRRPDGEIEDISMDNRETFYQAGIEFENEGEYTFFAVRPPHRYRMSQYRDFAKSITWIGDGSFTEHQPVGHTLEIVPLSSSAEMEEANKIEVEVLYNDQPVSGVEVKLLKSNEPSGRIFPDLHDEDEYEIVLSDVNGRAELTLDRDHNYILKARHQVSASDREEDLSFYIRRVIFRSTLFLSAF